MAQVLAIAEQSFIQVRGHFESLAWLLPGHKISLNKRGNEISDGVEFAFIRTGVNNDPDSWSTDTRQLSGGQRTLLSLAFMIAVCAHHHQRL